MLFFKEQAGAWRIWSLRAFLRRGRQPEENISRTRTVVSPRFLYQSSLMEKRYLAMSMWLCKDKLQGKAADFRLPPVSQIRACFSSLTTCVSDRARLKLLIQEGRTVI